MVRSSKLLAQPPSWRTTLCQLSPYLEAISFIHNPRIYHAMIIGTHITRIIMTVLKSMHIFGTISDKLF
jgi:hypothetical protein